MKARTADATNVTCATEPLIAEERVGSMTRKATGFDRASKVRTTLEIGTISSGYSITERGWQVGVSSEALFRGQDMPLVVDAARQMATSQRSLAVLSSASR
jgi:hypothetical protein